MSEENVEIVRAAFDAFARGDLRAVQACFHPGAELRSTTGMLEGTTYRGETLVEEWIAGFSDVWTDYQLDLEDVTDEGDAVIATIRNRGRARGSGLPLDDRRYVAFRFKDRRFWRVQTCPTMAEALEAAGLSE